jgi:hypothetical protein
MQHPLPQAPSSDDMVRMRLLDPDLAGRSNVRILSISADRIELSSPISALLGAFIQLRREGSFLLGEVRCCRAVGGTFQICVDVKDAFLTHPAASFHPGFEVAQSS